MIESRHKEITMERNGYSNMSPEGREMCEFIELSMRYDIEKARIRFVPGHRDPAPLLKQIQERYNAFTEQQRSAAVDLRFKRSGPRWKAWLTYHLLHHPMDARQLCLLEQHFGGKVNEPTAYIYENYGVFDRPWQMTHDKPQEVEQ